MRGLSSLNLGNLALVSAVRQVRSPGAGTLDVKVFLFRKKVAAEDPASAPPPPSYSVLKPRQWRLILSTTALLAAIGGGAELYNFWSSAPLRARDRYRAGVALMTPGHYAQAIVAFNSALATWADTNVYLERGLAYQALGQMDEAQADFEQAIQLEPGKAAPHNALAEVYRRRGDVPRALEEYDRSLRIEPSVDAHYQRGEIYASRGLYQKAIEEYTWILENGPPSPLVYRARALARSRMGDAAGAQADVDLAHYKERHQ
jgi:tetratricopeptide (TPR) repeat protein